MPAAINGPRDARAVRREGWDGIPQVFASPLSTEWKAESEHFKILLTSEEYDAAGPQVRRRRYALGWSQSDLATKLQLAGFDTSRSGVSKIEARLSYVDDKTLLYLAEVLKVQVPELFPPRTPGNRIHDFMEKLEMTRF